MVSRINVSFIRPFPLHPFRTYSKWTLLLHPHLSNPQNPKFYYSLGIPPLPSMSSDWFISALLADGIMKQSKDGKRRKKAGSLIYSGLWAPSPTLIESLNFWLPKVLIDSYSEADAKLRKHIEAYPQEQEPLVDSAISYGGKPRTIPLPQRSFTPIGHICLGRPSPEYIASGLIEDKEGLYWISNFYISRALQGSGLGREAMDTVENLAISEPLCAKTLALNAINKDDPEREEKYKALGLTIPPASIPVFVEGIC